MVTTFHQPGRGGIINKLIKVPIEGIKSNKNYRMKTKKSLLRILKVSNIYGGM
jgi:hypothetical protein